MKPILEVKNIGKKFKIQQASAPYLSLRDKLTNVFKSSTTNAEFWALKDVSFDVMAGDSIGIIGRNGAGKSTLLKILSKITPPSTGSIISRGRIASLLEVGTGFHPELSGRENIYLNGSILGLRRAEIDRQFDAIVDFSGVEKFLDTALKHYSSGMQLRLAFAVAAHLEPEILIIDEVLAVGDAEFQKKCMGKMGEVSRSGRTVLFVSHHIQSVLQLCNKSILFDKGKLAYMGDTQHVTSYYLSGGNQTISEITNFENSLAEKALPNFRLKRVALLDRQMNPLTDSMAAACDNFINLLIEGDLELEDNRFALGFNLFDEQGNLILDALSTDQPEEHWPAFKVGPFKAVSSIDISFLNEGRYNLYLTSTLHCIKMMHSSQDNICLSFEIIGNRANSPYWVGKKNSLLTPYIPWKLI